MNTKLAPLLSGCALCLLALAACSKKDQSAAVAHVGGQVITADEIKRRMDEQNPFVRARFNTVERKKELLEQLVRNELLAQEAQRQGFDKSPAVREAMKRAMIQELIKKQLDERGAGADLGDADLQGFYDAHLDEFVKPERARVFRIFLPAQDGKERAAARAKANALLKDIDARVKKGEVNAFQAAAIKESKDQLSAPMGGDLRFLSKDEMAKAYGNELAEAAFQLKNPGEMSGPVETPNGVDLLKLQVKTTAINRTFQEVKESIRSRIARERRSKDYDEFLKKLRENGKVAIDEVELARVTPSEPVPAPGIPAPQPAKQVPQPAEGTIPASTKIGGN